MFLSKDDLRKAVPKKGGNASVRVAKPSPASQGVLASASVVGKADPKGETVDIAERARRERLQRLEQQEANRRALRLQTWWRHWNRRRKFVLLLATTLVRKLDDLEKLSAMLAGKGVVFIPPAAASMSLIAQALLLLRLRPASLSSDLLVRCCTCLLPSIGAQTANVTCASALTCYALSVLPSLPAGSAQKTAKAVLTATHGTAFGLLLEGSGRLAAAIQAFLARCSEHLLATKRAGKGASALAEVLKAAGLSELWPLITRLQSPAKLLMRPGLALFFSHPLSAEAQKVLTSILHEPAKWDQELREPAEGSMSRGHWLTGNVCCLLHSHLQAKDAAAAAASSPCVSLLLQCALSLLESFPLPGFLQGIDGVVWTSQASTQLTAHSVPWVLPCQYSLLYDSIFLDNLLQLGVPTEAALPEIPTQDQQEVQHVLSQTSIALVRVDYLQQQKSASSWGSWAKRLVPSLLTSLPSPLASLSSIFSSKSATTPSSSFSSSHSSSRTSIVRAAAHKPSGLASDVQALLHVLLSPATSSPPYAVPWKALTGLVFNPNLHLTSSLLAVVLAASTSIERLAEDFDPALHPITGCQVQARHAALLLLAASLRIQLLATDDLELYQAQNPLPLPRLLPLLRAYKTILFKLVRHCPTLLETSAETSTDARQGMLTAVARNLQQVLVEMYSRWARRPFCQPVLWQVAATESASFLSALEKGDDAFAQQVLRVMPYALPFHQRLQLARRLLDADRLQIQGSNDTSYLMAGGQRSRGHAVRIHRSRLLEDAMRQMTPLTVSAWRDRLVIRYINAFGEEEAGIDAGGLFKDFLTDISQQVFSPSYGLFALTHDQLLYPNPAATALYDAHDLDAIYLFIGRVLGKAVLENIAIEPQFASFFLNAFNACSNLVNDLCSLDPELFRNLTFLKSYEGEVDDLCLTFSVTDDALGTNREVDLVPQGRETAVTAKNKHRYIHAVAKYYLRDRIRRQANAFFRGLHEVVTRKEIFHWFCAPELQILISGAQSGIDVADLQAHSRYAGGYFALDPTISRFWSVVAEFSEQERAQLLAFVTACPRPPSLGFSALDPPFTIQKVDCPDDKRLPTASTCFNILKLPAYSSKKVLREKLLAAITSKAGFDLS